MPDWLVVLLGAFLGSAPGVYAIVASRQKLKAEASKIVTDTAVGLLKPLQDRIDRVEQLESANDELTRQVREFRDLIRSLWEGVLILSQQLNSHNIPYAWDLKQYRRVVEKALGDRTE
jgi:hypothetical protein